MESHGRKNRQKIKWDATLKFVQAESIAEHIGRYLNSDNTIKKPWDFFPALFQEEKELYEKEYAEEQVEIARENRKAYAQEVRRRREMGIM